MLKAGLKLLLLTRGVVWQHPAYQGNALSMKSFQSLATCCFFSQAPEKRSIYRGRSSGTGDGQHDDVLYRVQFLCPFVENAGSALFAKLLFFPTTYALTQSKESAAFREEQSSSEERDTAATTLLENVALCLTVLEALCVLGLLGLFCHQCP